jgi:zinc transporter 7
MVAFAVGGLLGDTLLHLVPQTFMGEPHDNRAHFIMNDGRRNAVLGLFIFIGFAVFVAMDKTLRILTGGTGGDGHSHSHSHSVDVKAVGSQSGADTSKNSGGLKHRKTDVQSSITSNSTAPNSSVASQQNVKPSAILNLISDFTHNITDGLAMSGAFYTSPIMGATTCMAVMLHEIPHEIGDFALLIQGGFTKWQAMGAQFITALGAFTGTIIGICIQEYSRSGSNSVGGKSAVSMGAGILGSDLSAGDLVLPFTAGTFLYVGFSVIPELLENTPGMTKSAEAKKTLIQAYVFLFVSPLHDIVYIVRIKEIDG